MRVGHLDAQQAHRRVEAERQTEVPASEPAVQRRVGAQLRRDLLRALRRERCADLSARCGAAQWFGAATMSVGGKGGFAWREQRAGGGP
ncbi:hypothetical protein ACH4ND_05330 [Streptomyces sp. NPDC017179]|uniref:hypothetical protein n=1 Tax=Streptomyces sp. NPDC017179 TaxID=3364979 RepID=UPI0037A731EA